jgi:hypothetical protein
VKRAETSVIFSGSAKLHCLGYKINDIYSGFDLFNIVHEYHITVLIIGAVSKPAWVRINYECNWQKLQWHERRIMDKMCLSVRSSQNCS